MSNVINIGGYTKLDINPDEVLNGAISKLNQVLILGYDNDNNLYFASSSSDVSKLFYIMEIFKHKILNGDFD